MPAREVTEPIRPLELKIRPLLGNRQEAVLGESRPWTAWQVLAINRAVRRSRVVKEGPVGFPSRHCILTWKRHWKM